MYEDYSRQALPSKYYRELLGSALCVFVSNNSFIIENILRCDKTMSWYDLIDKTSGKLLHDVKKTIADKNDEISTLFEELIEKRNRIVHSFQCTHDREQIVETKDKNHNQFIITEEFLLDFIEKNEKLSDMLHDLRGY